MHPVPSEKKASTANFNPASIRSTMFVSGGSCAPTIDESITGASWASSSRVCDVDVSTLTQCDFDGVCAEAPGPVSAHGVCVWREGDHSCEELGPFEEKELRWTGFDDTRSCSDCSCDAPAGECAGVIWLYEEAACASPHDLMPTDGVCFQSDIAVQSTRVRTSGAACGGACQVVASATCTPLGGEPVGSAEPTGVHTFCCTG